MVKKYKKKPVIIEAVQWLGHNWNEICEFMEVPKYGRGELQPIRVVIHTLEGDMYASINDFIIKGIEGEFYPCKPDIFNKTYKEVEEIENNEQ